MSHKESGTATLLLSMFHLKEGREKKAKEYFEAATAFLKKRSEPPNDPPEYFQLLLAEELEELLDRVEK